MERRQVSPIRSNCEPASPQEPAREQATSCCEGACGREAVAGRSTGNGTADRKSAMRLPYRLRAAVSEALCLPAQGPWRLLVWMGSLGLGLSLYLLIARHLHIPHSSFRDVVATPAFDNYSEMQDLSHYLLALIIVPLAMLAGQSLWLGFVALLGRGRRAAYWAPGLATLILLSSWLGPLAWGPRALGSALVLGGGVLSIVAWLELARPRLATRLTSCLRAAACPPEPALQGAVALIGLGLGISALIGPRPSSLFSMPAIGIGACMAGLWVGWLALSYVLARAWQKSWRKVSQALAWSCLPLSLFFLRGLLWWEVWQAGSRVASHGSPWGPAALGAVALGAAGMVAWVALAAVRRGREVGSRLFWRFFWGLAVPLLLYAIVYNPNVHGTLDFFHEGERLATAQALLNGRVAYKDVVFIHGFGRDPGVALAAFRLLGVSVESLRVVEQWLAPLAFVASYYLVLASAGGAWGLAYSVLALTGFVPIFYDWRIVPAMAALTCMLLGLRRGMRLGWPLAAGLLTVIALVTSIDLGLVALASSLILGLSLALFRWRQFGLRPLLAYGLPLATGILALWLWAMPAGAWQTVLAWHTQLLRVHRDWNGMPFPIWAGSLEQLMQRYISPLASALALAALVVAAVRNRWNLWTWSVLLLLVANVTLFNRGIVGGAEQGSAMLTGSHFGPFLILQLGSIPAVRRRASLTLAVLVAIALVVPPGRLSLVKQSPGQLLSSLHARNLVVVPDTWVRSSVERMGEIYLPREQEQTIAELTTLLQGSTFWDQTDHGALYFLSDGASPSRFYATHHVITSDDQRQVIHDLSKDPPARVLYRSGTEWDAIAGVDRTLRSYLVSEYLLRNYHPIGEVNGFEILEPGPIELSDPPLEFPVNLGYVPFVWGQDRFDDLKAARLVDEGSWPFASGEDDEDWWRGGGWLAATADREGWHACGSEDGLCLQNVNLTLDPQHITYLALRLRMESDSSGPLQGRIYWREASAGWAEQRSALFLLQGDGQEHLYLVRLASLPSWMWSPTIQGLRIDLSGCPAPDITLRSVELFRAEEW